MPNCSMLPKDLQEQILSRFAILFQIVQLRSVCTSWRSIVPKPHDSCSLGMKIHIPFNTIHLLQSNEYCTLRKIPVFLLRFQTPFGFDYLLSKMDQTKARKPMLMNSPLSCYGISPEGHQMLLNSLTSHIIPLGHYYEISFDLNGAKWEKVSKRAELLELDIEGHKHCIVLAVDGGILMMFRSQDMKWTYIVNHPNSYRIYQDMVAFKGMFYVVDLSGWGQVFVIKPSLEVTEIPRVIPALEESSKESLVRSGEDLLLVQRFIPGKYQDEHMYTWFRVFKLDGEGRWRKWVRVNELKDQVIFLGSCKNICFSLNMLPVGVKGNCIVFVKQEKGMIIGKESILVYDLGTRKTNMALTECRGFMGAFGLNLEALVSGGIVIMPDAATSIYDL